MSIPARVASALALSLAPVVLLALVASRIHLGLLPSATLAFVVAATALVVAISAMPIGALRSPRAAAAMLAMGVVLATGSFGLARAAHDAVVAEVFAGLLGSAGVLVAACGIGAAVGGRIAQPGHLLAVACASGAADIWSVTAPHGLTRSIVETPDTALQWIFTISTAFPPSPIPTPAVGFGDVLFAALYLAATVQHRLARVRTIAAIAVGLLLAGACTVIFHRALPALPFIGGCVVVAQPAARRVAPADRVATAFAVALVVIAIVLARR